MSSVRASDARDDHPSTSTVGFKPGHVPALEDYRSVMAQRAVFQSVASMGLPAFTIHSIVRYSGRALKDVKNTRIRSYGPIGVSELLDFTLRVYVVGLNSYCSSAWLLYRCCHICSINRWRRPSNGPFIKPLNASVDQKLLLTGQKLVDRISCRTRARTELLRRKNYECRYTGSVIMVYYL